MSRIGVGVIGASPLRPGWAVTAHLPALLALSEYELRAVATSSEASAKAAGEAYGVPAYGDPAAMIARADIDLVVVTVKLAHHHTLVAAAIAAGKMVMCEWPLGVDFEQTADLAIGDLADIRSASAVRRSAVRLADTNEEIRSTAPDHLAIAAVLESGAVASIFYR